MLALLLEGRCALATIPVVLLLAYMLLVRSLRYQRARKIQSPFGPGKRPLGSMTTEEAHDIMAQLQELEFPYAMNKARRIALLKVSQPVPCPKFDTLPTSLM
jgi:hypothetical protein